MLYVHCNSEINSIEKDTVYIQFYDCLYKYAACFAHLFSLTVCSIVFCLSHFVLFDLCRTYFTHLISSRPSKGEFVLQSYVYGTMINWSP